MTTTRRILALCMTLTLAAACDSVSTSPVEANDPPPDANLQWANVGLACSADDPAVPLSLEQAATLPSDLPLIGDHQQAAETRDFPGGWGGMFIRDGVVTVYLVDPDKLPETIAAMSGSEYMSRYGYRTPQVAIKGRWTFAELNDWKTYLYVHQALSHTSVTSVDLQEAANRLEIGVLDEASRGVVEGRLRDLGAPCWLAAIRIQLPITDL